MGSPSAEADDNTHDPIKRETTERIKGRPEDREEERHDSDAEMHDQDKRGDDVMADAEKEANDGDREDSRREGDEDKGGIYTNGHTYSASPDRPPQRTAVEESDMQKGPARHHSPKENRNRSQTPEERPSRGEDRYLSRSRSGSRSPRARHPSPSPDPVHKRSRSPEGKLESRSPRRRERSPSHGQQEGSPSPVQRGRSRSRSRSRSRRRSYSRDHVEKDRDYRREGRERDRYPPRSRSPYERGGYDRGTDRYERRGGYERYERDARDNYYRGGDRYERGYRRDSPPRRHGYGPPRRTPPPAGLHLFVAGLNFIISNRELERKFMKYGHVKEARVVRNPVTGESRGFGFVIMSSEEEVEDSIYHLNGRDWHGRRLLVERARSIR